ncbi:MAG: DMT family transporter [Myxococcales bacterium]|nr:DMT family transporter [Myxococcales bacterium]
MTEGLKGNLLMASGALMVSFAPVFVKLLIGRNMAPTTIGAWRMLMGAVLFAGLSRLRGQRLGLGLHGSAAKKMARVLTLAALFFAIDLFVWHKSIVYVGAGMATILANTQVFWTAALGRVVFGDRLSLLLAIAAPLGFVGVVLLTGVGSDIVLSRDRLLGLAFGLGTGMAYACYLTALKRSSYLEPGSDAPPPAAAPRLAWIGLGSGVLLSGGAVVEQVELMPRDGATLGIAFGLALAPQVLGWLLLDGGLKRLHAARAALLLLLQPTFATIWGALFFGEKLGPAQMAGAAITLTAVFLGSYRPRLRRHT